MSKRIIILLFSLIFLSNMPTVTAMDMNGICIGNSDEIGLNIILNDVEEYVDLVGQKLSTIDVLDFQTYNYLNNS